jgi:hypothetical protein
MIGHEKNKLKKDNRLYKRHSTHDENKSLVQLINEGKSMPEALKIRKDYS